jgi:catechol 2,3-dioxygenase-like lactoylglutathione lyase family enzyme
MIHHTGIGVADVAASAAFYDAVLGALGMRRVMQLPEGSGEDAVGYGFDYPCFWIDRFHPPGTRNHTAFAARSRAEVDAFHAAGVKAGGADNGPPGLRDTELGYPRGYYAAFVLDPDGNNMEALFMEPQPETT